jgi:hypothetical protein
MSVTTPDVLNKISTMLRALLFAYQRTETATYQYNRDEPLRFV